MHATASSATRNPSDLLTDVAGHMVAIDQDVAALAMHAMVRPLRGRRDAA